ncbi:MAG: ATP-dependent RecD-like DNA helicase [Planctomycetota bacterium]
MPAEPHSGPGEPGELLSLQGLVDLVTYHEERTLYTVLKLVPEKGYEIPASDGLFGPTRVTVVGKTSEPQEGMRVRLWGQWGRHPTHGVQFEFERLEPLLPVDRKGLIRYLSSKAFHGIGEVLAGRIVDALGENALERIQADASCLEGIQGLRPEVADGLVETLAQQQELHRCLSYLLGLGLGPMQARRVLERFKADTEKIIRADPYRLAEVQGIGFATADRMALASGIGITDPRRLQAGLLHVLQESADQGHSCLALGVLTMEAEQRLELVGQVDWNDLLEALRRSDRMRFEHELLGLENPLDPGAYAYLPWLYHVERGLARSLTAMLRREVAPLATAEQLAKAEAAGQLELAPQQRQAVLDLLATPLGLLTGGPGVGKTTTLRTLVALAESVGTKVELASPTGRAAKRLSEATGHAAATVHRLLGFNPGGTGAQFNHGEEDPIEADLVIVDEISMLDVALAYHLLNAIGPRTRLILVGDPDQLPSVAAGNVLADMLRSRLVPTARLTQIFRQSAHSLIVQNAHRILAGQALEFPAKGDLDADFYFFPSEVPAKTADLLIDVVTRRIPRTFGFDWAEDVQVIAPMYKGDCGVDNLNDRLREALGAGGREVEMGNRRWRTGDRVIHTRNDYEREVFNGDMGRIVMISTDGVVTVRFPDQDVVYSGAQLGDLQPAFAITVHRSQGGEFPVVVIPLTQQHWMMLRRNLLYTAITRAKKLLILVGHPQSLESALANAEDLDRRSLLTERLLALHALPTPGPAPAPSDEVQ